LAALTVQASDWTLQVDATGSYLQHTNGEPFFWLGETGWLLPEMLNRENAVKYLDACQAAGFNVVQVQTINNVPAVNVYGATSDTEGYWEHMDYIIKAAEQRGIYIGMVCVWGGLVKSGKMDVDEARKYGQMLAERYKDQPNIVWIIGGDIYGDVKRDVWETLATTIKGIDKNHLMTFHPFGRHISGIWFHNADWLDFNMFQSGHRSYGQSIAKKNPDRPDLLPDSTEEDNWRYVEIARAYEPAKPVLDGEPVYEGIPHGLHDGSLPLWQDYDVRRYAYSSVFAGSFGHTYGNNAIMQMHNGNGIGGYGCRKSWQEALNDPGFSQMQHLKSLIFAFSKASDSADKSSNPYYDRVPDQSLILEGQGDYYDHLQACRGKDYLLVYDYNAVPFTVDLTRISGEEKRAWWYHTADGWLESIGTCKGENYRFAYEPLTAHDDRVLIVTDANATYTDNLLKRPAFSVGKLTCEQLVNPLAVAGEHPRLSWQINSHENGVLQTAYRILVATSEEKLARGEADVWDSGKVPSSQSVLVPYDGPVMAPETNFYWQVQVWTNLSKEPQVSKVNRWMTAIRDEKGWRSSQWIGYEGAFPWENENVFSQLSARYLRQEFKVRNEEIAQAIVHISGLGLYELYFNGRKVGNDVMMPGPTDYRKRVFYNTYDVTSLLQKGDNGVGVILGSGRFYPMRHNYKYHKWADFGYPKMRMVLNITYRDGRTQSVVSNESWQLTADGPIVSNNEFDGETYDARKELGLWSMAHYRPVKPWMKAQRATIPQAMLIPQPNEGIRVVGFVHPVSCKQLNDSTYIMDMGQNMAGWLRMNVRGEAGRTVRLRFAEALSQDGSLSMENLRDAKVTDFYTLKGDRRGETWAPRFTLHGFQYVEITNYPGVPTVNDFVGEVVSDNLAVTGTFESSSEVLNATVRNSWWGVRSNYRGMPIDCPQRNERMPWLCDHSVGSYGESFLFGNSLLYSKWMDDIEDAQRWDGAIPDVAPAYWNYYSDDISWPSAFFYGCDMLYQQFGDLEPMREHFSAMKRFIEYTYNNYYDAERQLMTADKYGDWCMPPESPELVHSNAPDRLTDGKLIATAYFFGMLEMMQEYGDILGRGGEITDYASKAQSLREGFQKTFANGTDGGFSNNTVAANLVAIASGLAEPEQVPGALEKIRHQIMDVCHGTMSTGVIGDQWLWRVLARNGYDDIVWQLATTTDYPSFGYMTKQGATTLWELWNGDTANPSMNSRNHVMQLGDFMQWCFEDLAGIRSDSRLVGFKHLTMAPSFETEGCEWVNASYETPYGLVVSKWKRTSDGSLHWLVSVPANSTAEITLPVSDRRRVTVNGKQAPKATNVVGENGVWMIGSGTYCIDIK